MHAGLKMGNSRFMVNDPMGGAKGPSASGPVVDPAGYVWWIATHKEDLTHEVIQQRAADFKQQLPQHV